MIYGEVRLGPGCLDMIFKISFQINFPSNPLGMENRLIADNQIIATDSFSHYKACYARLNGDVCWIAESKVSEIENKNYIQYIIYNKMSPSCPL